MRGILGMLVLGAVAVGGVVFVMEGTVPASAEAREALFCSKKGAAHAGDAARRLVERHLTSPGSAGHPWKAFTHNPDWLGDCEFRVTSFVDSSNNRGERVRAPYAMVVAYNKSAGEWRERTLRFAVNPNGPSMNESMRARFDEINRDLRR